MFLNPETSGRDSALSPLAFSWSASPERPASPLRWAQGEGWGVGTRPWGGRPLDLSREGEQTSSDQQADHAPEMVWCLCV